MKKLLGYALIVGLISVPAFAAKNSKNINLPEKLTVGTTVLPEGDYNVSWTGTGPTVEVKLVQKNASHPATATVSAKLVEDKEGHTGLTINNKNGVDTVETIQLNKITLVLGDAPVSGQ